MLSYFLVGRRAAPGGQQGFAWRYDDVAFWRGPKGDRRWWRRRWEFWMNPCHTRRATNISKRFGSFAHTKYIQ